MAEGGWCEDQGHLADVVKQVHGKLRTDLRAGHHDADKLWSSHLSDQATLTTYSHAMHALAVGPWATKPGECDRIQWCVDRCDEYFNTGALHKLLVKDLRRKGHGMPTIASLDQLPETEEGVGTLVEEFRCRKWSLLDVGSCYNPFTVFPQFEVTAVDIAPASESVRRCDFLNAPIVSHPSTDAELRAGHYDVVIFSLLLSYFPSPQQRLRCCVNAHKTLKLHGLLLIITPDSSHQNRHAPLMKSWKESIEAIGFHRWKYEKKTHLHCMAFRKTSVCVRYVSGEAGLPIPQDRELTEEESPSCPSGRGDRETFHDLPFDLTPS